MSRISVEQLFKSYGAYLRAKVQEGENVGFGGVSFRGEIAAHQELEGRYLMQLAADRRAQSAEFAAKLEAVDKGKK